MNEVPPLQRKRIRVRGIVQGVGFRPFAWKRATSLGLNGWVANDAAGVTIEIQGTPESIDRFLDGFQLAMPPLAQVHDIEVVDIDPVPETDFLIRDSVDRVRDSTPISPDVSICDDCLRELFDPNDRRFHFPFINCTHCGPRFTIIEGIPYDRPLTSMKSFPMCDLCRREYEDPANRRFHAQPNACPDCGPRIWWAATDAPAKAFETPPNSGESTDQVVARFRRAIESGEIVAVKGLGGFHLACDALNDGAVATLRQRKGRNDKPFAVIVRDVEAARAFADVSPLEQQLLEGPERPIVLLQKRQATESTNPDRRSVSDARSPSAPQRALNENSTGNLESSVPLSPLVAPGNDFVGVMLPYTPLHYLLVQDRPLVMTSGNLSNEPIAHTNSEARERLRNLADGFLLHNREIVAVCDDSVVRCVEGEPLPIRRSRGYAPMPVALSGPMQSVLAVGGELKATFCLTKESYAYLSQHIGDMENLETLEAMQRNVEHLQRLFRVRPELIAADLHPEYLSSRWAEKYAETLNVPLARVQHHHAHVAGLCAEHAIESEQRIIGCCFDGTGYGTDGAIWGGEFLIAGVAGFERFAHLRYAPLPGGDASTRRPYRIALAQLWAHGLTWDASLPSVNACPAQERKLLRQQLEKGLGCISTSSMGRLFDAVASLIGIRHEVTYEAQAALEMEARAAEWIGTKTVDDAYRFSIHRGSQGSPHVIDATDVLRRLCDDLASGVAVEAMAARFHMGVAQMIVEVCRLAKEATGLQTVGLTGGVFQNVLLLRMVQSRLMEQGFRVLCHSLVPPNDGGLALGQAVAATFATDRPGPARWPTP